MFKSLRKRYKLLSFNLIAFSCSPILTFSLTSCNTTNSISKYIKVTDLGVIKDSYDDNYLWQTIVEKNKDTLPDTLTFAIANKTKMGCDAVGTYNYRGRVHITWDYLSCDFADIPVEHGTSNYNLNGFKVVFNPNFNWPDSLDLLWYDEIPNPSQSGFNENSLTVFSVLDPEPEKFDTIIFCVNGNDVTIFNGDESDSHYKNGWLLDKSENWDPTTYTYTFNDDYYIHFKADSSTQDGGPSLFTGLATLEYK